MKVWNWAICLTITLMLVPESLVAADPARAKTLTVEQAKELLKKPNSLRVDVTEMPPEVAAILAAYKGELRFEALTTLSPESTKHRQGERRRFVRLCSRTKGLCLQVRRVTAAIRDRCLGGKPDQKPML